ncbi:MAG TPA: hypothetical protein DD420_35020 [Streptomyces sp.]|nr:hypothetical protein [Streptomyces sp.]
MLQLRGYDDGTPVHVLRAALMRTDPGLAGIGGSLIDLCVVPHYTGPANGARLPRAAGAAWYSLLWASPVARTVPAYELFALGRRAAVLPAPKTVPVEDRLAAADPVSLSGLGDAKIRLLGGPERARTVLEERRDAAIRQDRSTDIYDWDAYASHAAEVIRALPVPAAAGAR